MLIVHTETIRLIRDGEKGEGRGWGGGGGGAEIIYYGYTVTRMILH